MTELGDTEGWTCAEWEGRGLETGWVGRKGHFLPHQDLVLTANAVQEQPLPPNPDLLIAGRQPTVLRPSRSSGSSGMLSITPLPLKLLVLVKTMQLPSELINCVLVETDFDFKQNETDCEQVGGTWMCSRYFWGSHSFFPCAKHILSPYQPLHISSRVNQKQSEKMDSFSSLPHA